MRPEYPPKAVFGCSACRESSATASIRLASTSATAGRACSPRILYEVHNTFGQRHCYLIPVAPSAGAVIDQQCDKTFYVSPFLDMDMTYAFRVALPVDRVSVAIRGDDRDGLLIVATLTGRRVPLTNATLLGVLLTHPLLTLKVIGAIHWHALRMLLKGYRLRARPAGAGHSGHDRNDNGQSLMTFDGALTAGDPADKVHLRIESWSRGW